jgi:hypothetical protein
MSMRTPATIPPVLPAGRATGPAARSGAPPGETPFAAFLENDRARTAVAEGPKSDTPSETRPADRRPVADRERPVEDRGSETPKPSDDAPVAEERPETPEPAADPALASPAPATVPAAAPAPVPAVPVPVVVATETQATAQVAVAAPVLAETTAVAVPQAQAAAATDVAPVAPQAQTAAVPAQAATTQVAEQAAPQEGETAAPAPPTTASTGEGEQSAGDGQQPGRREDARVAVAQQRPAAEQQPAQRPAAAAQTVTTEPARAASADATRATEVTTAATPQQAPAAPPSTQARGAVPLEHAQRTVEAALQVAAQRSGVTRARLQLHPAELGAIEIHLRHSASGVTARLVADSAEALQLLQQNGSDLRRSLESAGIDVLGLDIGARGDERRADQGAFAGAANGRSGRRASGDADGADDETTTTVSVPAVRARLPLPGGALLDVLA